MFDHSVIGVRIIPNPNISTEVREKSFADSNELVRSVQRFIDDLMKEHMTATFAKAPVVCYIRCSQCKKTHIDVEKATVSSVVYCPIKRVHADITDYHKILSGLQLCCYMQILHYRHCVIVCIVHLSNESEIHSSSDSQTALQPASPDHSNG